MTTTTTTTKEKLEGLWTVACQGMASGQLGEAFRATDELLYQASKGNVVSDMLPDPRYTALGEAFGAEMLQSLVDRVESLNGYIARK